MLDVIVIGGGPGGVTAALRARELGANVTLVERGRLGGTCTNDGCAPTRVLAKAARLAREANHFSEYGLYADEPTIDFARALSNAQQKVYRLHEKKQLLSHFQRAGIRVLESVGNVQFVDARTIQLGDGARFHADRFIICAGGHARQLKIPGGEHALTHSQVWAMKKLPASIVIVGGAATGCQLASIVAAFGARVHILESHAQILGTEDEIIPRSITQAFQARGIAITTQVDVQRIDQAGNEFRVEYVHNGETKSIVVGGVLQAVGWVGNIENLNLAAANVQTTERGYIAVNDYQQTSAEHIFAAGDITGRMMLVQSASYEGRIAAENAVLGIGLPYKHLIVPHGGFTDPEYAGVGLTEARARERGDCIVAVVPYADIDRAVIDDHTEGFCKLIVSVETHRILGAHVVGEQAVEIVQLIAAGMAADIWVEQLAELEIAYPTYAAIVGLAARRIVKELGVMPLSPQWRALGQLQTAEWEARAA